MTKISCVALIVAGGVSFWILRPARYSDPALPESYHGTVMQPAGPIRLTVMKVGYSSQADLSDVVDGAGHKKMDMPTFVFFVDHPGGKILIDSGYGRQFGQTLNQFPYSVLYRLIRPVTPPESSLERQLQKIGIGLDDITHIVLTHAHNDHAGGARDCPRARIYIPREEWEGANRGALSRIRGFMPEQLKGWDGRLVFVDYGPGPPYGTFERSYDLMGDGSIILVSTPGHTAGSQSVFINLPSGTRFFYAGDTAWVSENYLKPAMKGPLARRLLEIDEQAVWENLWRIRKLSELAPDITIIPGHDPTLGTTLRFLPEFYQ